MAAVVTVFDDILGSSLRGSAPVSDAVVHIAMGEHSHMFHCIPWDGVYLWANRIADRHLPFVNSVPWRFATLNYCLSGRCEVQLPDETYVYMRPGTLCFDCHDPKDGYWYPTCRYTGLEMAFNLDLLRDAPPEGLSSYADFGVWIEQMLSIHNGNYLAQVSEECQTLIGTLFAALTAVGTPLKEYRYQTLQLLYRLMHGGMTGATDTAYVSRGQRQVASEIEQQITADLSKHFTIEELATERGISASSAKQYFEKIYGLPLSHYLREKRIDLAKSLLSATRLSVGEIAEQCGYSHQGKFGKVFKEQTGFTPLEYRRLYFSRKGENE